MPVTLPQKLRREPLVDCVFEIRFKSETPVGNMLPGIIFARLDGEKKLEGLPASELPAVVRGSNPELRYAPLLRIDWQKKYFISIGDYNLGISAKMPYGGWTEFKPAILSVLKLLQDMPFISEIERCAYKSTNIFEGDLGGVASVVKFSLSVGDNDLSSGMFHIRSESTKDEFITIIQVASEATAHNPERAPRTGVFLDLDIISNLNRARLEFLDQASDLVQKLHDINKNAFFRCITEEALKKLEPIYAAD